MVIFSLKLYATVDYICIKITEKFPPIPNQIEFLVIGAKSVMLLEYEIENLHPVIF